VIELRWGERTWVMGVINVTPDSFSGDGIAVPGRSEAQIVAAALELAHGFVEAGAQILDVGAESSRPAQFYGEHPDVAAADEAALAVPVVAALVRGFSGRAIVSIDTTKGVVARSAIAAGATIVNDVWAGRRDPDTVAAAAEASAHLVLMHNKELAEYPDGDPAAAEALSTLIRVGQSLYDEIDRAMRASIGAPESALNTLAVIEGAEGPLTPSEISERTFRSSALISPADGSTSISSVMPLLTARSRTIVMP